MALRGRQSPLLIGSWLCGLIACVDARASLSAQNETLLLDEARSSATFSVKVLWMVDVEGQFGGVRGKVEIDHFRSRAVVDAQIDANAVTMRRQGAENWVKSEEFFNVATYPEVHFVSAAFPLSTLVTGGELPGTLTLRGIANPIVFTLLPSSCALPGFDCPLEAVGTLKRGNFGMRSRKGTLADRVELRLNIRVHSSATYPAKP